MTNSGKSRSGKTEKRVYTEQEQKFVIRNAQICLARASFWDYCRIIDPEFYRTDRQHLVTLCDVLNNIYSGTLVNEKGIPFKKLMINVPPRFGKTRTLIHFCEWILGLNNSERIIACSYNDDTAADFSRYTRDGIQKIKLDPDDMVFSDVFPDTKIKHGYSGFEKWALEGQHFNYLGAGIGGSITSKGASVLIVDDPIKGAVEAYNANHLEKIWLWYTSTFLSRTEGDPLEIIVMTRWSKKDICGNLLNIDEIKDDWYVLTMEAYDENTNKMLCSDLLSRKRYFELEKLMDRSIFRANYHQQPITSTGALYQRFNTYDDIPKDQTGHPLFETIDCYVDSADTGDDWNCGIVYGIYLGRAYVLDVYYSGKAMEITEPGTAELLFINKVKRAYFESNGAGRGFARNVQRLLWENHRTRSPVIKWFHQSLNKEARIYTWSAWAQENIIMPKDWPNRWNRFHDDLMSYTKEQPKKNERDDAPDAVTGVCEMMNKKKPATAFQSF